MVTTVILAAVFALGNPAFASDPVDVETQQLRDKLFVASVRLHSQGSTGLKDLVLSAEMLGYRQLHPDATVSDILNHSAVMSQWYDSHLTNVDATRQAYEMLPRILNIIALHPEGAVAAPIMKEVLDAVVSPNIKAYGERLDQVATAQFSYDQFERWYPIQDMIWRRVTGLAQADSTFAEAWDGNFGARLNVLSTASMDQLAADPLISVYLNVGAILDHQMNTDLYIQETKRQILEAIQVLQDQNEAMIGRIGQLNGAYPVMLNGPRPTAAVFAQQRDAAAERQRIIDGAGTVVDVLSTLLGFADPKAGRIVGGVGKAAVQIATAINKYIPAIAGLGLGEALASMSTIALTGNILGAIGALLPVFAEGPTPDQLLMEEMRQLRQDVAALANSMQSRFDRVEHALTVLYSTMLGKFDEILALQNVTIAKLAEIERNLYNLNTSVNNWGAAIMEALRQNRLSDIKERINWGIGHQQTYGEPIQTYADYQSVENPLHLFATDTAYHAPFNGPDPATYASQDPLVVLQNYKAKGAVDYLDWYARQYYGWTGPAVEQPADVVPWIVAARSYARLVAENPAYARQVNEARTGGILGAGQGILTSTAQFSRPLSAPDANGRRTNALFTNLLNDYNNAMQSFSGELGAIRVANSGGKVYNLFGSSDQLPDQARVSDDAAIGPCTGSYPSLTRPSTTSITATPNSLLFAQYAHPDRPTVRLCYSANFTNFETVDDYKWHHEYADLEIVVRIWVRWPGQGEWDYRTWKMTYDIGEYCRRYISGAPGGYCNDVPYYLNRYWNTTYLTGFNNGSAFQQTNGGLDQWTKDRMGEFLTGRQKTYYGQVATALGTVGTPLFNLNARLTKVVKLLQAYTQLGWAKALDTDDLLALQTFGVERLPADWTDLPFMTSTFVKAQANYGGCNLLSNGVCAPGTAGVNPLAGQAYIPSNCSPGTPPGYTGDPVGDCVLALGQARKGTLSDRYAQHSQELLDGLYVEGMPDVTAVIDELTLANAFVRHA